MNRHTKFWASTLLATMLLLSIAFVGTAAPDKKDRPIEQIMFGLNDSELYQKDIPDFGPEVFDKLKKDSKIHKTKGKIPKYKTQEQRLAWLDKLNENRVGVRGEISKYVYPKGPVIGYGYDWEGYFLVDLYENSTFDDALTDEIYSVINKHAVKKTAIQEIPVVFSVGGFPQLEARDDKFRPIIGGVYVQNDEDTYGSTIGFAAVDQYGDKGYVVSGHLGTGATDVGMVTGQPNMFLSNIAGAVTKTGGTFADAAWVPYSDVAAKIYVTSTNIAPVKGDRAPTVGMTVYKAGIATGTTSGSVERNVDEIIHPDHGMLYNQWFANYTSAPGDSGAPVYTLVGTNRELVGIHSGKSGAYATFSPVSGIIADLGVLPLTS